MPYGKGGRVNDPQNPQHEKTSTLPPPLQRIIDRADEDEAIYDDYWAGRYVIIFNFIGDSSGVMRGRSPTSLAWSYD